MPRLLPEATPLNSRASRWIACFAAGAAAAAAAGLLSRWCASPALGWSFALAVAALGARIGLRGEAPEPAAARVWALTAALAALAIPALLRFLGLALAEASLLHAPLGGFTRGAFVLGQVAALAALSTVAWTRAVRGAGRPGSVAALAGAAAAAAAFRSAEASVLLAAAALILTAAAFASERPWASFGAAPTRARGFVLAVLAAAALATQTPALLVTVWLARLHSAYPGGGFLSYRDDGSRVWTAFAYSNGERIVLRDGVIQSLDKITVKLALRALMGQREAGAALLLVNDPDPWPASSAVADGASVVLDPTGPGQTTASDALTGPEWRKRLRAPAPDEKLTGAAVFFPVRASLAEFRRYGGPAALRALRARLPEGAGAALVLPEDASAKAVERVATNARAVFGSARIADLPRGTLVLASPVPVETDHAKLFAALPLAARLADPKGTDELAKSLVWRPAPSGN